MPVCKRARPMPDTTRQWLQAGLIREVDYYLARHLAALDTAADPLVVTLAALASAHLGQGHVCLELASATEVSPLSANPAQLRGALTASALVGKPGDMAPLILDGDRLYLARYWWYEYRVAEALRQRSSTRELTATQSGRLIESLRRMFPSVDGVPNEQGLAAAVALLRQFAVISGGPGTGKTYTVTGMLAALLERAEDNAIHIALAAPTGKAAARLAESIAAARGMIDCSHDIRARIPGEATTLHRLLGIGRDPAKPRHHAGNPLPCDLLVIDEASMIDLPLMARTLDALPDGARLILLGDRDQLASVEAGSVFADIAGDTANARYTPGFADLLSDCVDGVPTQHADSPFADNLALLTTSRRFDPQAGIGLLAAAINRGDSETVLRTLGEGRGEVSYRDLAGVDVAGAVQSLAVDLYTDYLSADDAREALDRFNRARILCAVHQGPTGVGQVNDTVVEALRAHRLISQDGEYYRGRPVMMVRNDPELGLFNGDVGMLWPSGEDTDGLKAWFEMPDGSMQAVSPARLPGHVSAFAITVHKSQGSEFDRVLLILPTQQRDVLTRELLYTAVTRARRHVGIWGVRDVIASAVACRTWRASGLRDRLF